MKPFFLFLFFLVTDIANAQHNTIDSLKHELEATKNDTMRLVLLNQLSNNYFEVNFDSGLFFAQQEFQLAQKLGYKLQEAYALAWVGFNLAGLSNNARSLEMLLKGIKIAEDIHIEKSVLPSRYQDIVFYYDTLFMYKNRFSPGKLRMDILATLHEIIGFASSPNGEKNKQKESSEFSKAIEIAKAIKDTITLSLWYLNIGYFYTQSGQLDSAFIYLQKGHNLRLNLNEFDLAYDLRFFGNYYIQKGNYLLASDYLHQSLQRDEDYNLPRSISADYLILSELHFKTGKIDSGLFCAKKAYEIAKQVSWPIWMFQSADLLVKLFKLQNNKDSTVKYLETSLALKDSINNIEKTRQFQNIDFDQQMHQQEIEKEKAAYENKLKIYALLIGITVLFIVGIILFRNILLQKRNEANRREIAENELRFQQLESEKTEFLLQQQSTELEIKALRAQMNPHFIFNSLNSINRFILQNNKTEATEYLTKFSRLIRMILNSSASTTVSLTEDLEALQLYLELECLRFGNEFSYKTTCDPEVDADFIRVPPMLLQPFVENAIWHGLMNKKGKGHLWINIDQDDSTLICTITDDGIGRRKAAELKSKSDNYKSMGMNITESRIAMMNKINGDHKSVAICDLVGADGNAAGTEVIIKIPLTYD